MPKSLHSAYPESVQSKLVTLAQFIGESKALSACHPAASPMLAAATWRRSRERTLRRNSSCGASCIEPDFGFVFMIGGSPAGPASSFRSIAQSNSSTAASGNSMNATNRSGPRLCSVLAGEDAR